jgi:hypothetical protein
MSIDHCGAPPEVDSKNYTLAQKVGKQEKYQTAEKPLTSRKGATTLLFASSR